MMRGTRKGKRRAKREAEEVTYFNDLVARERQKGNVSGIASHEVAVEDTKDRLVCND